MHWAITGHTAAELIKERADADKPHMGLNTWEGAKIHSKDVTIAKNYLTEDELKQLNKIVTMKLNPPKSELNSLADNTEVSFVPMNAVSENGQITTETTTKLGDVKQGYTYFQDKDVVLAKITPWPGGSRDGEGQAGKRTAFAGYRCPQ